MHVPPESVLDSRDQPARLNGQSPLLACCEHLEELLRAGQPARAETYFAAHGELAEDAETALDLVYVEFATRRELGEGPSPQEYFERFPQWRDLLERQFALENLLEGPALGPHDGGDVGTAVETPASAYADRFRVQGLLARGGIGQVMRAVDTELRREVAVKELQPAHADSEEIRARFLREAEITGKLEHPGIVPVYGLGRDAAGRPFYAMRLVKGQSLQEAAEEFHRHQVDERRYGGIEFQKLLRRFLHVCQTVAYAHSRGVVHRDLKPENILLGPFGETLVVDWGLAKVLADDELRPAEASNSAADAARADDQREGPRTTSLAHLSSALTQDAGQWIGTPAYMCPEQALGQAHRVGTTGDVYSLGATLYLLLTGRAPIVGSNVPETLKRVIAGDFLRPRELCRAIPRPLEAICQRAMALRPEDRYRAPNDLADDLERWLADEPVTAVRDSFVAQAARWGRRNRTPVAAAAIALVVVTVVSLVAAISINGERLRADHERIKADRQRVEADRRNARLAFDRGFSLTESHDHGAALLWFARALSHTPKDDEPMRRVILTNMDAARHHLLRRRRTFTQSALMTTAKVSEDGKQLATADHSGQMRLWDIETGQVLAERELPPLRGIAATFVSDGTVIFALLGGQEVSLEKLSAAGGAAARRRVKLPIRGPVTTAAFSPAGELLAIGNREAEKSSVRLWRVPGGELAGEFPHPTKIARVAFRPQHQAFATVGSDGKLRLWDIAGIRPMREINLESRFVERFAFTPDGMRVIVGDSDGAVSYFEVETGRQLCELARASANVIAVECSADGQVAAAARSNGTAQLFNLVDRRPLGEQLRHDRHASILAFRPQSRQMLVASEPKSVVLWDLPDAAQISTPLAQGQINAIAFSREGKMALTGNRRGTARLRDAATGKTLSKELKQHQRTVSVVAFRADGAVVLTASYDGTAQLWNAASGEPQGKLMDHRGGYGNYEIHAAAFSPDGRFVLTGGINGVIRIWDGDTGEHVRILEQQRGDVRSICFSKSGDLVVAGWSAPDSGVRAWNLASGKLLWTKRHDNTVRSVAISPNGSLVLSASNDGTARLWNAVDGQPVGTVFSHRGEVFVAAFSPDGTRAVTGGYDATVRLWAIPSGTLVGEPMRHEGVVTAANFSSDGKLLLTGGSVDRSARLWDVATCLPLSEPWLHNDAVYTVGLQPGGRVAYTDRLWRLPAPLPDEPALVDLWVQVAIQRSFTAGDNIEWLRPAEVAAAAEEFQARTGKSWDQWAE